MFGSEGMMWALHNELPVLLVAVLQLDGIAD
jgi:hypothetical protein